MTDLYAWVENPPYYTDHAKVVGLGAMLKLALSMLS